MLCNKLLMMLTRAIVPPILQSSQQISSMVPTAWLCMAARLGIPDLLKNGPRSATQIAAELGVREEDIYRAMRMLVKCGYFEAMPVEDGQGVLFRNNSLSAVFREDHPNSLKYIAIDWHGNQWACFGDKIMSWHLYQKGEGPPPPAFEKLRGCTFWEHLEADPQLHSNFSRAMQNVDSMGLPALIAELGYQKFERVLDIGGGSGSVMALIAAAHPTINVVVFDQPHVIEDARRVWSEQPRLKPLKGRAQFVGGSFFDAASLPPAQDGDLFFLKNVLHDWSDEDSISILRAIRKTIGQAKASVALAEFSFVPEFGGDGPLSFAPAISDMFMHGHLLGKERTEVQWKALFRASGFALTECRPTRGALFVIKARPV